MTSPARAFHAVEHDDGHGVRRITASEYARLPLSERIRCVLEGRARFLAADGTEVGSRAALAWLREQAPSSLAS